MQLRQRAQPESSPHKMTRRSMVSANLDGNSEEDDYEVVDDGDTTALISGSETDPEVKVVTGKGIAGDERNIAVLLFLYILQGIPLGLAAAVPLILTNRNVNYKQQAEFR